jgi:hypothetical protein
MEWHRLWVINNKQPSLQLMHWRCNLRVQMQMQIPKPNMPTNPTTNTN